MYAVCLKKDKYGKPENYTYDLVTMYGWMYRHQQLSDNE